MSLVNPIRHRSASGLITDGEANSIVRIINGNCLTAFGTVDEPALLKHLRRFKREGHAGNLFDDFFLTNNAQLAAYRYRMHQLRRLIGFIQAEYLDDKGGVNIARAFHRVTTLADVPGAHGYVHIKHILGNPALESQVVARMAVQRATWNNAFHQISAMSKLIKRCQRSKTWKATPPRITYKPIGLKLVS